MRKRLGCAVTHFLEVGASLLLGAVIATNLNIENEKNEDFWQDSFKGKSGGVTLIYSTCFFSLF